ncbi:MAG: prohibitin family protein, partial [Acidobacteria bacterium]|nr:prohibitin family protein [Acidobacteriota bacterium]
MKRLIALLALLPLAAGCTPHTTQATQVGVRFNKITRSSETSDPGATYFFMPIINDWATYDTSTQN